MKEGKLRGELLKGLVDINYINQGTNEGFVISSYASDYEEERLKEDPFRREYRDKGTFVSVKDTGSLE